MNIEQVIEYLKTSLFVLGEEDFNINDDPEFIKLDEGHLEMVLNVAMSSVNSTKSLRHMSQEDIYPVILLARKEIYYTLATKSAPLYDLSVAGDAGSSRISRDQRFRHYYDLIEQVNREFNTYMSTGRLVQSGEAILDSNYYTNRNYNLAESPTIFMIVDNVYPKEVELTWEVPYVNRFGTYKVYISKLPIIDEYEGNIVRPEAKLVKTMYDFHQKRIRVGNLDPKTAYNIAVVIEERNGLKGYSEMRIETI